MRFMIPVFFQKMLCITALFFLFQSRFTQLMIRLLTALKTARKKLIFNVELL